MSRGGGLGDFLRWRSEKMPSQGRSSTSRGSERIGRKGEYRVSQMRCSVWQATFCRVSQREVESIGRAFLILKLRVYMKILTPV